MKTLSVEMVKKETGELSYVVANLDVPDGREKSFLISNFIKERIAEKGVVPTGNIFVAEPLSEKSTWTWHTVPVEGKVIETSEFDVLAEQWFNLSEALKAKEKELIALLNSAPEHRIEGKEYGGFNEFTASTRLAYAQLYDTLKQKISRFGKAGEAVLDEMKSEETKMTSPHKSSEKSFKVFRLGLKTKDEFAKIWKG